MVEIYEEEYTFIVGYSGLTVFSSMSAIKTASTMNNVGINISQLRIFLRILRHKIGATLFEPELKYGLFTRWNDCSTIWRI